MLVDGGGGGDVGRSRILWEVVSVDGLVEVMLFLLVCA